MRLCVRWHEHCVRWLEHWCLSPRSYYMFSMLHRLLDGHRIDWQASPVCLALLGWEPPPHEQASLRFPEASWQMRSFSCQKLPLGCERSNFTSLSRNALLRYVRIYKYVYVYDIVYSSVMIYGAMLRGPCMFMICGIIDSHRCASQSMSICFTSYVSFIYIHTYVESSCALQSIRVRHATNRITYLRIYT